MPFFLSGKLKIILYEWRNSEHDRVSQTIYYADIGKKKSIDRFDNVIRCHFFFYQASWKLFCMNGEILNTIESVKRYITSISGIKNPLIGLIIRTYNTLPFFFLSGKLKIILYEWRNSEHHRVSQTIYYADIGNKESIDRFDNVIRCHFFFLSGKLKIILYEHHRVSQTISGIKNPLIGLIM